MTASYEPPSFLRSALKVGAPFAIAMTVVFTLQSGWRAGLTAGPAAGLAFGVIMAGFVRRQGDRLAIRSEALDGERIVHQGSANHWRGKEARGGWLVLTERALVFRSHGFNVQNAGVRVELAKVRGVSPSSTLGIVPNGLRVELVDGTEERFVVGERPKWLAYLAAGRPSSSA
jgi:hypothetical protein